MTCALQCHRYHVAPASGQLLMTTYGISAQEQKHLTLVLLLCLDHPYGIHCLQLFAIHYWHTDNSTVNWKVLCLIELIWLTSCAYVITICYKASTIIKFCLLTMWHHLLFWLLTIFCCRLFSLFVQHMACYKFIFCFPFLFSLIYLFAHIDTYFNELNIKNSMCNQKKSEKFFMLNS